MKKLVSAIILPCVLLIAIIQAQADTTYTVTDLGTLGGTDTENQPVGINASGQIAAKSGDTQIGRHEPILAIWIILLGISCFIQLTA